MNCLDPKFLDFHVHNYQNFLFLSYSSPGANKVIDKARVEIETISER